MAASAMTAYYPMIYDFLVEQARTTNTNQSTHKRSPASQPHAAHSLAVRTAGPLQGSGSTEG